jgi:hypothetical protein
MPKRLEARVAEIIDDSRIALTVGSEHGVAEGDDVTLWRRITVSDPESGEVLGETEIASLSLRVFKVDERFCLAATKTSSMVFSFGKQRRIAGTRSSADDPVPVKVNDRATVTITDVADLI